ncbi:HesA/MoeB/ThiF family protein [Sulfurospirillum sp. 1307]|jgi:molybdopterin/thiamine biosynthesis adenylyltransferase
MSNNLEETIKKLSKDGFIPLHVEQKIAKKFDISLFDIEKTALQLEITPLRYKRNQETITPNMQLKLLNSHVAIIGSGGLGGHIAENLTRIGVGELSIFDFDIFEEHNLNRQNFSSFKAIGKEKVLVVKENLEHINPIIKINAYVKKFTPKKDFELIQNCDVIVDALDDPGVKLDLSKICKQNNKNFVHGAIAGFSGQFTSNSTLENLYKDGSRGAEVVVGNPSFSVTFAASIQSCETIKLLLNIGETLKDNILMSNLLENEFILI